MVVVDSGRGIIIVKIQTYEQANIFTYEQIQSLNELELEICNYILKNTEKVLNMSIRELAAKVHVSTATILRFSKKMGCQGYAEFKLKIRMFQLNLEEDLVETDLQLIFNYLKKMQDEEKKQSLQQAVSMIYQAQKVIFIGAGTSGIMAKYGAKYLLSMGKLAQHIDDPYTPIPTMDYSSTVIVAISVSGETPEVMYRLNRLKELQGTIISITNSETSTIARLSDVSLFYHVVKSEINVFDVTTQIPVIYLIETIGKHLYKLINNGKSIQ